MTTGLRIRCLAPLLGLALLTAPVPGAGAAVTLGSNLTNPPSSAFGATSITFVQTVGDTGSFVSPIDGVVVRWRVLNPLGGSTRPRVLRTANGGATFTGVGTGPVATSPAAGAVAFPLSPGLTIKAGDYFGADQLSNSAIPFATAVPAATTVRFWNPALADGLMPSAPVAPTNVEMLVNADVELDADGDRFGDESQDACPKQSGAQALPCNAFTIDGAKALKNSKVRLSLTVPGAGTLTAGAASDKKLAAAAKAPPLKRSQLTLASTAAATLTLTVEPSARGRALLEQKGKLRVRIKVVYAPSGGTTASSTIKAKLKS